VLLICDLENIWAIFDAKNINMSIYIYMKMGKGRKEKGKAIPG
jgi:hypothetical protein